MDLKNTKAHLIRNLFSRAVAIFELTSEEGPNDEMTSNFLSTLNDIELNWNIYLNELKKRENTSQIKKKDFS